MPKHWKRNRSPQTRGLAKSTIDSFISLHFTYMRPIALSNTLYISQGYTNITSFSIHFDAFRSASEVITDRPSHSSQLKYRYSVRIIGCSSFYYLNQIIPSINSSFGSKLPVCHQDVNIKSLYRLAKHTGI